MLLLSFHSILPTAARVHSQIHKYIHSCYFLAQNLAMIPFLQEIHVKGEKLELGEFEEVS